MKLAVPPRPKLIIAAVLLATNVLTGVVTALVVRARDFSEINVNSLLNLGAIDCELRQCAGTENTGRHSRG